METMEIVLLIVGGIIFVLSFFIPERKGNISGQTEEEAKKEIEKIVNTELDNVRGHISHGEDRTITGTSVQ